MPVIDIFHKAKADGTMAKFGVKADPQDENGFRFEADIAFTISGPEDAKLLESNVPGAITAYQKAMNPDDNWKWSVSVKPSLSVLAEISNAVKGLSVLKGAAEVKSITVRASKKVMTAVVRLAWGGQPPEMATNLARLLRNATTLSIEPQQQALPFRTGEIAVAVEEGDIVVARLDDGAEVSGFAYSEPEEVDGIETVTLNDCGGKKIMVPTKNIVSVVNVEPGHEELIADYIKRSKMARRKPSTKAILAGLLAGGASEDGKVHAITPSVIEAALEYRESTASGDGAGEPVGVA